VQSQLANLTMQLQDMAKGKVGRENVCCTLCCAEGHHQNECPRLRNDMTMGAPNLFPTRLQTEWCKIYRKWGHVPPCFPTLQKYQKTTHTPFYEFCKPMGYNVNNCRSLQLMKEHIGDAYWVQEENKGGDCGGFDHGGFNRSGF